MTRREIPATSEPSHTLCFMGVGPVETFRCRIYSGEPREPLTEEEARGWLLAECAMRGNEGAYAPNYDEWHALVETMTEEGLVHMYRGLVFLGPDYKRPEER